MAQRADSFELASLGLSPGEGSSIELVVPFEPLIYGDETYTPGGETTARFDVSHTTSGYALRLRYTVELHGPCMRCLDDAGASVPVDAREVDQPGDSEEMASPYVLGGVVDIRSWARDALALALPAQIFCRADCKGLCAICGENLNEDPDHVHEAEPDPRWAKLSELKLE
jgi:uncharacterized protein